ncbi:MAG: hypothetical protein WCI05_18265, partial [Myxococcales bacterium]
MKGMRRRRLAMGWIIVITPFAGCAGGQATTEGGDTDASTSDASTWVDAGGGVGRDSAFLNDSFSNADVSNDAAPKSCSGEADCKTPDFCTNAFTCEYHFCKPIGPPSCDDQIDCTVDSCDTVNAACLHVPSDTSCGNGKTC